MQNIVKVLADMLLVDLFGQETSVEVELSQIENA